MLLLCVMVLMTLSIGSKILEKNDLNHMADVAAYNQAVVVSRTFNSIALINRTQVSHMVALAGVQSLISWTGAYRGTVAMLRGQFAEVKKPVKDACDDAVGENADAKQRQNSMSCGCVKQMDVELTIEPPLAAEERRLAAAWEQLDAAAAAQARAIRDEADIMYGEQLAMYREQMLTDVGQGKLVDRMVDAAKTGQRVPEELIAPHAGADVAMRELEVALDCSRETGSSSVVCASKGPNAHAVWAAMGTRGWAFTTSRADQAAPFMARLAQILPSNVSVSVQLTGSGYFADDMVHGMATTSNQSAWADDHVTVSTDYTLGEGTKCSKEGKFGQKGDAWVKAADNGDEHRWPGMSEQYPGRAKSDFIDRYPAARHQVALMWPRFLDYNTRLLDKPEDGYGQPKTYAVIQRDYAKRTAQQPWEQLFSFGMTRGGSQLDLRSSSAHAGTTLQTSLSSGVAYYHRPGHWKEPPNFFNPFWRATLMASDLLDKSSLKDMPNTLQQAKAYDAAETYTALYQAGYRGF